MKSLHAVPSAIDQTLAWFGPGFRCEDNYHNGYNHEREDGEAHHDCAHRQFMELDIRPFAEYALVCECYTCNSSYAGRRHYFPGGNGRERRVNEDDLYICEYCFHQQHPTPPEGTT